MALSILLWVVSAIVGYCVSCWIVGFSVYFAGKLERDEVLLCTVFAPYTMPIILFRWLADTKYEFHVRRMQRVSQWIAEELQAKGIAVSGNYDKPLPRETRDEDGTICINIPDGYNALRDQCRVYAEVMPEQIAEYQNVYARALKKFPKLTPAQICGSAEPPEPLDRAWAKRVGISEYFAEELFAPCVDCGVQKPWEKLLWGDEVSHAKLHWADKVVEYALRDGRTKVVEGHLCDVCEKKLDWKSSHWNLSR